MDKLQSLRTHLVASIPELASDPERLQMFVEHGTIEYWRGAHYSHRYRASVRLILLDWVGSMDIVILPLLTWLSHYEPDFDPGTAIGFEAELLGTGNLDLILRLTLSERVVALVDPLTGRLDIEHRLPEFPADAPPVGPWELWCQGERISAQESPA